MGWKPAEDEKLRELVAADYTWNEIVELFDGKRSRGAITSRATKLGLRLGAAAVARAREASLAHKQPTRRMVWKQKTGNLARISNDFTPAQEAARKLQRVGPVYPMRVVNPKLTDWMVWGQRMTEEEMRTKAERYA